ncbi:MAG TPA: phosphoribosylformylglycinamidine cyclo-ligase, partial [Candidatus Brevibacterium intestinavium]|nr:phosphoribosylformylglycinamidine cyclo-ligase [Candidatus Brevibacterium intestinavium]
LVRHIIAEAGWDLDRQVAEFGRTLGEELLVPTHVYTGELAALFDALPTAVHSVSHVTGGGLSANVARVLPQGLVAKMSRASWEVPAVFSVLGDLGGVPQADRERTWNLGVGMVLVVDPAMADGVIEASPGAWVLGEVVSDDGALADDPFYVQGAKGVDGGAAILQ